MKAIQKAVQKRLKALEHDKSKEGEKSEQRRFLKGKKSKPINTKDRSTKKVLKCMDRKLNSGDWKLKKQGRQRKEED